MDFVTFRQTQDSCHLVSTLYAKKHLLAQLHIRWRDMESGKKRRKGPRQGFLGEILKTLTMLVHV